MDAAGVLNLMREAGMPAGVALDALTDETRGDRAAAVRLLCDAIHAGLDADRADHGLRVLMADVLDVDTPGAGDGWRALGVREHHPDGGGGKWWTWFGIATHSFDNLIPDWFDRIDGGKCVDALGRVGPASTRHDYRDFWTRRAAEEAAAAAFLRLPASRRAELLGAVAAS